MSKPRLKSPPYQHSSSWAALAIPAIPCELDLAVSALCELGSHSLAAILCELDLAVSALCELGSHSLAAILCELNLVVSALVRAGQP